MNRPLSGILMDRLHAAGLLPLGCGDITITDNYNNEPVGIRITFHCHMTKEIIEALVTPTKSELEP